MIWIFGTLFVGGAIAFWEEIVDDILGALWCLVPVMIWAWWSDRGKKKPVPPTSLQLDDDYLHAGDQAWHLAGIRDVTVAGMGEDTALRLVMGSGPPVIIPRPDSELPIEFVAAELRAFADLVRQKA